MDRRLAQLLTAREQTEAWISTHARQCRNLRASIQKLRDVIHEYQDLVQTDPAFRRLAAIAERGNAELEAELADTTLGDHMAEKLAAINATIDHLQRESWEQR